MSYSEPKLLSRYQWKKVLKGVPSKKDLAIFKRDIEIYERSKRETRQHSA